MSKYISKIFAGILILIFAYMLFSDNSLLCKLKNESDIVEVTASPVSAETVSESPLEYDVTYEYTYGDSTFLTVIPAYTTDAFENDITLKINTNSPEFPLRGREAEVSKLSVAVFSVIPVIGILLIIHGLAGLLLSSLRKSNMQPIYCTLVEVICTNVRVNKRLQKKLHCTYTEGGMTYHFYSKMFPLRFDYPLGSKIKVYVKENNYTNYIVDTSRPHNETDGGMSYEGGRAF